VACRECRAEDADNPGPHRVGEIIKPKMVVRARDFLEESLDVDHPEIVGAECAQACDPEILIPDHHRIRGSPVVTGEQPGCDEVHIGFKGRLESVFPPFELRQNGDVVGREGVLAGPKGVAELAEIHELSGLRFAHDKLRTALNLAVSVRIPI